MAQAKRCSLCGCFSNMIWWGFLLLILVIIPGFMIFPAELFDDPVSEEDCVDPSMGPEDLEALSVKSPPPLYWVFNMWLRIWKQIIYWSTFIYVLNVFVQIYEKFLAIMNGHNDHNEERQQSPFEIACKRYGALVIVYPKEAIYPEHISHLLALEAISYGIRPAVVPYEDFDPAKLLTTRHIVFIFPKVNQIPAEINNLIRKLGHKDFVRDAFLDLKFSVKHELFCTHHLHEIFFPQCCTKFAETLAGGMRVYKAQNVPATLEPVEWNSFRFFRNWSNAYWVHNLLDITRIQLLNRTLKPNPIFAEEIAKEDTVLPEENIRTPYEDPEIGTLEFKEPIVNFEQDIHGWNIGVCMQNPNIPFRLGEKVKFLFSNSKEHVRYVCETLDIDPDQVINVRSLEEHFPNPLCPELITPDLALTHYYDIYAPISGIMYNALSFFAVDNEEIMKLSSYGTDILTFGKIAYPHLPALLDDFTSISMNFVDLIMLLPRIAHKAGHVQEIQTEGDNLIIDISLVSHSDTEPQTYSNHIINLNQNDSVLLQHTNCINKLYLKLPEFQNKRMVFFITDVSIGFLCSYLANRREALDWHIICQPDAYWVPTLQDDLKDGKIKSVEICDTSFNQTDSLKTLTDFNVCIIAQKANFVDIRNEIAFGNPAINHHDLAQSGRWVEIDLEDAAS